jgi:beta-1,4-mannosyl-glycoprotein beta-1,4-N-acetylglucosaminyltransferase
MTFYNELDLLTYRLNILNDVVDYFIIVEAKYTHSGIEKPLFFNENKQLFSKFHDKIIHIIVEEFPFIYPNINYGKNEQWGNEHHQRNMISQGLAKLTLQPSDLIVISDLDEIPNPDTLLESKKQNIVIGYFNMVLYYYNLNTLSESLWEKAKIISYGAYQLFNLSCTEIRHVTNNKCVSIKNGGWHLSYFGDASFIQNKIKTFGHQEINKEEYTNIQHINHIIKTGGDISNRSYIRLIKLSIKNNHSLPPKYDIYLQRFIQESGEDSGEESHKE